jgi:transposase
MLNFSRNGQQQLTTPCSVGPEAPPAPAPAVVPSVSLPGAARPAISPPNPEVAPRASRRNFSLTYKRAIVAEVDACQHAGQIGAILRREGLYYSALRNFRVQLSRLDAQNRAQQAAARPGPKARSPQELSDQVAMLQREKKRLEQQLLQAQKVIEVQKKLSEMLGIVMETPNLDLEGENL